MIYISTKKKVLRVLVNSFLTLIILGIIITTTGLVITNIYKPAYKVMMDDNVIGYVRERTEFDDAYNTLKSERVIEEYESNIYLKQNPSFEKCYVKDEIVDSVNIYTNLREYIETEYKIYDLYVKDVKEMSFTSKEEAQKYLEQIKGGVTEDTTLEIKEEVINNPIEVVTSDRAEEISADLVSRYKPVEVKKPVVKAAVAIKSGTASEAAKGGVWPTSYKMISDYFGARGGRHMGVDFANDAGTPIFAYKAGTVTAASYNGGYGNMVVIDHGNGVVTRYAHCSTMAVSVGQSVAQGQVIAGMGSTGDSTGNHLHFEILVDGTNHNPMNYLD